MSIFLPSPLPTVVDTIADLATKKAKTGNGKVVSTTGARTPGDNGGADYIYYSRGRSGVTLSAAYIAGPGLDDYFKLKVRSSIDLLQFLCVADGVADDRAAIASADTFAQAENVPIVAAPGTYFIDSNLTITSHVYFDVNSKFKLGENVTLTLNGGFTAGPTQKILDASAAGSDFVVNNVDFITADHCGASPTEPDNLAFFQKAAAAAETSNVPLMVPSQEYTFTKPWSITADGLTIKGFEAGKSVLNFPDGASVSCTADALTNQILSPAHGLVPGQQLLFSGNDLPAPLSTPITTPGGLLGQMVRVNTVTADAFTLVLSTEFPVLTTDGSGAMSYIAPGNMPFNQCSNVKVDGITLKGNRVYYGAMHFAGGYQAEEENVTVTNCVFTNWGVSTNRYSTVVLVEWVNHVSITNNIFINNDGGIESADISCNECNDIIISNNQCLSNNGYGVSVDNFLGLTDIRFVISNNIVRDKQKHGLLIGYAREIYRGVVSGNVVYNCAITGLYMNTGDVTDAGRLSITGNMFSYCGGWWSSDDAGNTSVYISGSGGTFTGNLIERAGFHPERTFTVDTGSNEIVSVGHELENSTANDPKPIQFRVGYIGDTPGVLPSPLALEAVYYVVEKTTDRFKVSATPAGAAIDITTAGSGVIFYMGSRKAGRGRGMTLGNMRDWTITGNTIMNTVREGIDFLVNYRQQNILINGNVFVDSYTEPFLTLYYGVGSVKNTVIQNNVFIMREADSEMIHIYDGDVTSPNAGVKATIVSNEFIGRKAGTGIPAIWWKYDRCKRVIVENNVFRNLDEAFDCSFDSGLNSDWMWGEVIQADSNTFENVTTPFNLRASRYAAVGTNNKFVDCEPGFSHYFLPAKIDNQIMTGYYVDRLPVSRCRPDDRLKSLRPLSADHLEWHQTAALPAAQAFTVTGSTFNCTSHGLQVMERIRFSGGSLPAPLVAGTDYWVATVPTANTFTISSYYTPVTTSLTTGGSGNFQKQTVTAVWESDIFPWLLRKPYLLNRWDGAGSTPDDYQNVQDMTWTGTPAYGTPPSGKGGAKSFVLDGATKYLKAPIPAYVTSNPVTFTCWFKKTTLAPDGIIFNNQNSGASGWWIGTGSDGNIYLATIGSYINFTPFPVVAANTWVHLALVFNGADSGIYTDGLRRTTFNILTSPWVGTPAGHIEIGGLQYNATLPFGGEISDLRVYEKALSLEEIVGLYNGPSFGY